MVIRGQPLLQILKSRFFCTSVPKKTAYDSDGKTTITILNKEAELIMIDSYTQFGFRLNNGMFVLGPMVLFPRTAFSWNVRSDQEINKDSLALFTVIQPRLDLLVIGLGETGMQRVALDKELLALRARRRINLEVLPVVQALATFNYLSSEGRWVAGAFIPPSNIQSWEAEVARRREKRRLLYETDD